jgi:hypothetical protein
MIELVIVLFENWHWEMNSTSKIGLDDRGSRYLLCSTSGMCIHIISTKEKKTTSKPAFDSLYSPSHFASLG